MKSREINSFSCILALLLAFSVIPSCAFAIENGSTTSSINQTPELKFGPGHGFLRNITEENFADIKETILNSISRRITELQDLYAEVNKTSNVSELKTVVLEHRQAQANECMGPERMGMRSDRIYISSCGINGFYLSQVENVTDENLIAVRTALLSSLQNTTEMLKDKQARLAEVQQDNQTQALNESLNDRISKLQNLSNEVNKASTAAELKEVVFRFLQTQSVDLIDREIEQLKIKQSEINSTGTGNDTSYGSRIYEQIGSRITELTTLKESINGAKSLDDLKQVMYSSRGIPGFKENMNHHRGHGGRCGC